MLIAKEFDYYMRKISLIFPADFHFAKNLNFEKKSTKKIPFIPYFQK